MGSLLFSIYDLPLLIELLSGLPVVEDYGAVAIILPVFEGSVVDISVFVGEDALAFEFAGLKLSLVGCTRDIN